ncbi:YbbR domain-containing protein [Anoxybacillus voinovskiensis]|uniref:YbbR domain-containing protein n=1 Tax=Anoxybacteroides voinovskiense TaxID=230470 RepID=A0A840DYB7_9BACL|nr:CdaR family protein [Anoxybacillus voinovskiensis]MBB4075537.1 YbbR domain-containing protein [Anoxybacillus voinovskiensis]GGJ80003.1 CdaA regulatory protein CdaR [Anoxybacillus voinovskiensis]
MDKLDNLMNNHWFMKIFALLLAIMLYMSVNIEGKESKSGITRNSLGQTDVETVTNVPVVTYYDEQNLVVSGVPKTVNVTLEGPASILKPTALQRDFEIYVDLANLELGTYTVPLKYKNISDKLKVTIEPSTAKVTIQEKVSRDFSVDVDFIHKNKLVDGYSVEEPIVKPSVVTITGAKDVVERIALVKARVDLDGAVDTVKQESRVRAYDREGKLLDVNINPSVVEVTVPIKSPSKSVPLKINRTGTLKAGLSIVKIEAVPNEVTIFGPKDKIDPIEFIDGITINLDDITSDTTLEVPVPLPEGVKSVDPAKVKIHIEVQQEETKTFSSLPIHVIGLGDKYNVQFLNPKDGNMDVQVSGAPSVLNSIRADDLQLYVNASELGVGEHDVEVEVNGPQNITWKLPSNKAKIRISERS